MGRLLLTNNNNWRNAITKVFDIFFDKSFEAVNDNYYAASYRKLNINNVNSYSIDDRFIVCTGTIIYKQLWGETALKELLLDSESMSVKEIRENTIGSYAVVIKNSKRITAFIDETHTYFLYYHFDGVNFLISNSCWHIAHAIGVEVNDAPLLEMGVRRCIMSNQTQYKRIYKLSATECFKYDLITGEKSIEKVQLNDYKQDFSSRSEAVTYLVNAIKELSGIRSKYIKKYHHFLTGGIDSRLELAINVFNSDNIQLGYWMGQDLITNGTPEDASIVTSVGEDLGLSHCIYDVSEEFSDALSNISVENCMKYGDYASIYAGNKKWFEIFESLSQVDAVGFGYLGESMRPLGELDEQYHENFTVDDYIKGVYCRCGLEKEMFRLEGFYEFIRNEIEPLIILNNGNEFSLSKDIAFKLFSYSRFEADCLLNNFGNLFVYSFPILGSKKISDAIFSLNYDWLNDDYMSIRIIEELAPRLLDYPIYSHHRTFLYNKSTSTMVESFKYHLLDTMKSKFKDTFIYKTIYLKYAHKYIRPQSRNNEEIMKQCARTISNMTILDKTEINAGDLSLWKGGDMGSIATFIADLLVISINMEGSNK